MRTATWLLPGRLPPAVLLPGLLMLSGCLGDAAVAPGIAPVEVVADSAASEGQRCTLNRYEVGAGVHEVIVIAQGSAVTVRVVGAQGSPVLETEEDAGGAASTSVELAAGEYDVSCIWASGREQVTFRVTE